MGNTHTGRYPVFLLVSENMSNVELSDRSQELVSRFSSTEPKTNVGVLEVAHSIFNRWRPLNRSNELYIEINHVVNTFGQPFLQLLAVGSSQKKAQAKIEEEKRR